MVTPEVDVDPAPTQVEVALRWGDMDILGHVNNVAIARLLEEARVRAFTQWFAGPDRRASDEHRMVIARQTVEFVRSMAYSSDPVQAAVWVSRIGNRSYDIACEISESAGDVCVRAETTAVAIDTDGQALSLGGSLLAALRRHLGPAVAFRAGR